jgi:hypothetical protein
MVQRGKDTVQIELLVLIYSNLARLWKKQQVVEGFRGSDKVCPEKASERDGTESNL